MINTRKGRLPQPETFGKRNLAYDLEGNYLLATEAEPEILQLLPSTIESLELIEVDLAITGFNLTGQMSY